MWCRWASARDEATPRARVSWRLSCLKFYWSVRLEDGGLRYSRSVWRVGRAKESQARDTERETRRKRKQNLLKVKRAPNEKRETRHEMGSGGTTMYTCEKIADGDSYFISTNIHTGYPYPRSVSPFSPVDFFSRLPHFGAANLGKSGT